jgi:peptidoglycan/LPS O-acetylase OafA/YrhL
VSASTRPLIVVDLIRFPCAAAVMLNHYGASFWVGPRDGATTLLVQIAPPGSGMVAGAQFGWMGVELFFVISGMVIAQSARGATAAAFLRRRASRLVPCAWICATATAIATAAIGLGDPELLRRWLGALIFWPLGAHIDPSYWTLGVELSFYLLVAARLRDGGDGRLDRLAAMLIGWSAAFWTAVLVGGIGVAEWSLDQRFQLTLAPHGCLFALGIVIARAQEAGWTPRRRLAFALALATCLVEIVFHATERSAAFGLPLSPTLPILAFAAGLCLLVLAPRLQPWAERWISPERARAVGLATYPLYLIHQEAGAIMVTALSRAGVATGPALALTALAAAAFAWVVVHWLEPPTRRAVERMLDRLSSRGPEPNTPRTAFPRSG